MEVVAALRRAQVVDFQLLCHVHRLPFILVGCDSRLRGPFVCGISGLVNCGNREALSRMTHVQAHRGPDDSGLWEQRFPDGSYIGLGSRRLAILDLSASGHMPMANEERSVFITYNGEVYN